MADKLGVGARQLSYRDVLGADSKEVPKHIRQESRGEFDFTELPIERYVSRDWHEREKERLWKRVWQLACREEHIAEVGDHIVYEIAGLSYLVIRSSAEEIRAYPNACLHRARQLKDYAGRCDEIRCPFHGITWRLDGKLKHLPAGWEFPHIDQDTFRLPAISVGTWAGFVFINPDPDAEPLETFLGDVIDHFARWDLGNRYVQAHASKVLRCNWKVAQEAFMECWHGAATHPQTLAYTAFGACQVDCYDNFSRFITPSEVAGPMIRWEPTTDQMLRATLDVRVDEQLPVEVEEGQSARAFMAGNTREKWRPILGDGIDEWADCELVDSFTYTVFPNIMPWGGLKRICYRFRPNGDEHRSCIMEVFYLSPFAGERPPPAQEVKLGVDDLWSSVAELGITGNILDQDTSNMEKVQSGMETTHKPRVTFAAYQEDNIRWLHGRLDRFLEDR
jgi:phenylpropionate dioxygenase-like ring-hydroxylating dioxygenase large terminal subunit